jgi:hypothetical protein
MRIKPCRAVLPAGVAYVPQGNRVFTDLTMRENLEMGGITLPTKQAVNEGVERVCSNGSGGAMHLALDVAVARGHDRNRSFTWA